MSNLTLNTLKKIDWDKFYESKNQFELNYLASKDVDTIYRIYHNSFKMYYFAENCLNMWLLFFNNFGMEYYFDNNDNLEKIHKLKSVFIYDELEKLEVNPHLLSQISLLKDLYFTMAKNKGPWAEEGLLLVGLNEVSLSIIKSYFNVLDEWKNEKGLLFEEDRRVLTSEEALFMRSFRCFSIRRSKEEEREELRNYFIKINRGEK